MPMYDTKCTACDHEREAFAWSAERLYPCLACGAPVERVFRPSVAVIDDQLPGGPRWIENMAATPIYVENKTQWKAAMKQHGVRHVDDAEHRERHGSDIGKKRMYFS